MPYQFLMSIKGTKQGDFKGKPTQKGKPGSGGWLEIHAFSFGASAPLDNSTGSGGGRQTHSPFQITKQTGSAPPTLFQTIVTSETFKLAGVESIVGGTAGSGGSGSNTGKHSHPPIVVTREVDEASALLLNACFSSELLKTVQISFTPTGPGKPEQWQTITLTNAIITNVRRMTVSGSPQPHEDVYFVYESIEISYGLPK